MQQTSKAQVGQRVLQSRELQIMDPVDRLEIFIPVEAEVKSVSVGTLPKSVVRQMGLHQSESEACRKTSAPPEAIWICPAVVRRKGHVENVSSLLGQKVPAVPGPLQMSFVSENLTAYKVLKDTMPGNKVSAQTSQSSLVPPGSAPRKYRDTVIIHNGLVYLTTRTTRTTRTGPGGRQPETQSSQSSQSSVHKHLKKASLQPADKRVKRKNIRDNNNSTTDHEVNNNRSKLKPNTCRETNSVAGVQKTPDVLLQTSGHRVLHQEADVLQAAGGAAGSRFHLQEEQQQEQQQQEENMEGGGCDLQVPGGGGEDLLQMNSGGAGVVDEMWSSRESQGAAGVSSSLRGEVDFQQLAQEEKIARMKAKLRKSEAACNLHAS
ncbi:putative mediator of RNA polymerase II transcription subunit 15 [Centropristis striata]|uniref:putative mediator of RNA polymerase II transcription subunit 15 n=1 Tax=Centropristis striata TaxID=184440 RepID=UPI0027DF4F9C|nr:putative mediator of RNA polymerase II transcription subunit 15 [Centropristis striata]